jgi:integrase
LTKLPTGSDPAAIRTEERRVLTVSELADLFVRSRWGQAQAWHRKALSGHFKAHRFAGPWDHEGGQGVVFRYRSHPFEVEETPYQANRVLAVMASMYSFAAKRNFIPSGFNPAHGLEKYAEEGRERFLSIEELERLGAAIREAETVGFAWAVDESKSSSKHVPKENRRTTIGPHAAGALRLLLFTGRRLREILHVKWEHGDFERVARHAGTAATADES